MNDDHFAFDEDGDLEYEGRSAVDDDLTADELEALRLPQTPERIMKLNRWTFSVMRSGSLRDHRLWPSFPDETRYEFYHTTKLCSPNGYGLPRGPWIVARRYVHPTTRAMRRLEHMGNAVYSQRAMEIRRQTEAFKMANPRK